MRILAAGLALAAPFAAAAAISRETAVQTINLGYFSRSVVIGLGVELGFFSDQRIVLAEKTTASSPNIFANLKNGTHDIILTQADNVFNYRYNTDAGLFDPVVIGAADRGGGSALMANKEATVETVKDIIVDNKNSGLAFVAYGIMKKNDKERRTTTSSSGDYDVWLPVGDRGTPARFTKLKTVQAGNTIEVVTTPPTTPPTTIDAPIATILIGTPLFLALELNFSKLGGVYDAAASVAGSAIVVKQTWLDNNKQLVKRFLAAYLRAQRFVLDPANKGDVISWLKADIRANPNNSDLEEAQVASVAAATYAELISPGGLICDLRVDAAGLLGTANLRQSFGGFTPERTNEEVAAFCAPGSGFYDMTYLNQVLEDEQ